MLLSCFCRARGVVGGQSEACPPQPQLTGFVEAGWSSGVRARPVDIRPASLPGLYEASQAVIAGLSRLQCSIASMIAHAPVWGRSSSPKAACARLVVVCIHRTGTTTLAAPA